MRWPNCLRHELEFWQRGNRVSVRVLYELNRRYPGLLPATAAGSPQARPECLCRSTRAASHTAAPVRPEGARVTCLKGGALFPLLAVVAFPESVRRLKSPALCRETQHQERRLAGSAPGVNALARTRSARLASRRSLCARQERRSSLGATITARASTSLKQDRRFAWVRSACRPSSWTRQQSIRNLVP